MLLAVLVALAGGIGTGLAVLGLAAVVAGIVAAIRGQARWAFIVGRRLGLAVAGAGLVAVVVGAAVSPPPPTEVAADSSSQAAIAKRAATAPTTTPAASPSASPSPEPVVVTTSQAPLLPPPPAMAMTCPTGGSVASPVFGEQITAAAPYTVAIDYGDGDHYSGDDQHLRAIFSHTYKVSGNFTVDAVLTDVAGQTTTASCTYSWTKAVATGSTESHSGTNGSSSGGGSSGGSSSGDDYYTNVDGNQVHVPVQAPTAPAGATAQCKDGSWSFSQHHQGTCSGHGGVDHWLG